MKKSVLLLALVALFIIQTVSAGIVLNNFETVYNKGELLPIEISILSDTAVNDGLLNTELVCEGSSFTILDRTVDLEAAKKSEFVIDNFKIPSAAEGDCHVEVRLSEWASKSSTIFEVSDELKAYGDFQVNPALLQLGKTLILSGYLTSTKEGTEPIKGLATIYFKTEDKEYYAKDVDVVNNKIKFSYNAIGNKPGEYSTGVLVEDSYGNKKLFSNVAKFKILDEVYIFVEPIQTKVLPGSTLHLSGELSTTLGESVKEGNVEIILLDEPHKVIINDGKFSYDLKLPTNIESGEQTIKFSFEEDTGNKGSTVRTIQVEPVPTEIKLNTFQTILKPQEVLEVAIYVYDQGNEEILDTLKVELLDTNGKSMYLGSVESEEKLSLTIPQHGVPGVWKLKANYQGLVAEKTVNIDKVKNVDIKLEDNILYITNTGNVDYNEPVSVSLNDGEFKLNKEVSLKPGGVLTVNLADEAPYGQYNLKVTGVAVSDNQFDNVFIQGKDKRSLNVIYSALLIFVITALAYLTVFKKRHFRNAEVIHYKNVADGQRKLRELKDLKEDEDSRKPRFFTKERSIEDFKQRMLKNVNETEDKYKGYRSSDEDDKPNSDDQPKGMFNMFG